MSTAVLSQSHSSAQRPATMTWAVAIIAITTVLGFGAFFLPGSDEIPMPVIVFGFVVGAVIMALCWWAWKCKKWAVVALTIVTALNMLSSLPGLIEWPSDALGITIILGIPLTLIPIWLLWHPASRKSFR